MNAVARPFGLPERGFRALLAAGHRIQRGEVIVRLPIRGSVATATLSASIYTRDVNKAFAAMRDLYTGIFYVNAPTIGAEVHLPFGGTKATGTAIARPGPPRWTSSRSGSRSTWISAAACSGRRSTRRSCSYQLSVVGCGSDIADN